MVGGPGASILTVDKEEEEEDEYMSWVCVVWGARGCKGVSIHMKADGGAGGRLLPITQEFGSTSFL